MKYSLVKIEQLPPKLTTPKNSFLKTIMVERITDPLRAVPFLSFTY